MKKPVAYSGATCTCTDCGRVLWVEDGPTCTECLVKRALNDGKEPPKPKAAPAATPAADVPAPKKRSGCCG